MPKRIQRLCVTYQVDCGTNQLSKFSYVEMAERSVVMVLFEQERAVLVLERELQMQR